MGLAALTMGCSASFFGAFLSMTNGVAFSSSSSLGSSFLVGEALTGGSSLGGSA